MPDLGHCRSCGAPVLWVKTSSGRPMPVDYEPEVGGNLRLRVDHGETIVDVVSPDARTALHRPHFATCPDAESWRKR